MKDESRRVFVLPDQSWDMIDAILDNQLLSTVQSGSHDDAYVDSLAALRDRISSRDSEPSTGVGVALTESERSLVATGVWEHVASTGDLNMFASFEEQNPMLFEGASNGGSAEVEPPSVSVDEPGPQGSSADWSDPVG